ncbi:MAG: DNA polymerase [Candidatus Dojkabacteria bacterium]|nr:MAG: DNA polymerase [Candidatus Dojkabacteria bacterium]
MTKSKNLVIIDSHALLYRAYYAMPPTLTTRDGEVINAVYGFASLVLDVIWKFKPTNCLAVLDSGKPVERVQEFSLYKANRKKADDLFIAQIPKSEKVLEKFDIPILKFDGIEADDIIGTVVEKYSKDFDKVIIVTGDQDMFQLVKNNIYVYMAGRRFSDSKLFDSSKVEEKLGITPDKVADFKGISGDPSDNIPGVAGIGKKGAVSLIKEFGGIEDIYKNIEKVPNRYKNKLLENYEMAMLSKSLATIKTNIPLNFDINKTLLKIDNSMLEILEEFEFKSLVQKASKIVEIYQENGGSTEKSRRFENNTNYKEYDGSLQGEVYIYCEYDDVGDPLNYGFKEILLESNGQIFKVDQHNKRKFLANIYKIAKMYTFDAKKFLHVLHNEGVKNTENLEIEDVGIYAFVLAEGQVSFDLNNILKFYKIQESNQLSAMKTLYQSLSKAAKNNQKLYDIIQIEHGILPIVVHMERAGIGVDDKELDKFKGDILAKLANLRQDIYDSAGCEFNVNSTKQVSEILFEKLGLTSSNKTKTGSFSTNEKALIKIKKEHRIVSQILLYRELEKLSSTYVKALPKYINPKTNRIHAVFDQMGTVSGRFSSRDPNLQNIPKGDIQGFVIRNVFKASPGCVFVSCDYSQQELRILAGLANEQEMIDIFNNNGDVHKLTASELFDVRLEEVTKEQREIGKVVNFSVIYGISAYGLSENLKISVSQAQYFIDKYFNKYKRVREFFDDQMIKIKKNGYAETIIGRRRRSNLIKSSNKNLQASAKRELLNFLIQGSAADIMKLAMLNLIPVLQKYPAKLIAQIHDEFLFEVKKGDHVEKFGQEVSNKMLNAYDVGVDFAVEISVGERWGEMKKKENF